MSLPSLKVTVSLFVCVLICKAYRGKKTSLGHFRLIPLTGLIWNLRRAFPRLSYARGTIASPWLSVGWDERNCDGRKNWGSGRCFFQPRAFLRPTSTNWDGLELATCALGCKFTNDCFATVNQKVIQNKTEKRGLGTRSAVAMQPLQRVAMSLRQTKRRRKIMNALSTKC